METGKDVEGRPVDTVCNGERRVEVLEALEPLTRQDHIEVSFPNNGVQEKDYPGFHMEVLVTINV